MPKSKVAVLRTSPATVLRDYHELMNLAGYQDVLDREADARHPTKRNRPIARGAVAPAGGVTFSALLVVLALSISEMFLSRSVTVVLTLYLVLTLLYSFALKRRIQHRRDDPHGIMSDNVVTADEKPIPENKPRLEPFTFSPVRIRPPGPLRRQ